jgi:antagonist of KipI
VTAYPRLLPVGDAACTIEMGDAIDPETNARVRALDRLLADSPFRGFVEAVPTHRSLLVLFDPSTADAASTREWLGSRLDAVTRTPSRDVAGALHLVPTRYGGDDGPDLAAVAIEAGRSEAEAVRLHASTEYTAYMLGFTPGFAYLGPLPRALHTKRRGTPRPWVPAGSVALAGGQTGIYPRDSPGGWKVIGRTALRLFDPDRADPALIQPGDRVRFVATEARQEGSWESHPARGPSGAAAVEVLAGGFFTTVQAAGRVGYRRLGVPSAGALDAPALAAGNALAGNSSAEAGLECTLAGPRLRFLSAVTFAVTGADLGAALERPDHPPLEMPPGSVVDARPGDVLLFRERRWGCRAYVAFAGGIDVPVVLGSRSTDTTGGFGGLEGRKLRSGDRLQLGGARGEGRPGGVVSPLATAVTVRVVLGPQADAFRADSLRAFLTAPFAVTAASNRSGCRLSGPVLGHEGPSEIVSDGMVPGCVQVPPDGQPIVMLADSPTTGGYPKIATVLADDLHLLAQVPPGGGTVSFRVVGLDEV